MLKTLLEEEYGKGNYVIAGGDFNQQFSGVGADVWPVREGMWKPGIIEASSFSGDFSLLMDPGVPTCRSLDRPYAGESDDNFQFYMIDGFIVSRNVRVESLETLDRKFVHTDHNPVLLKCILE